MPVSPTPFISVVIPPHGTPDRPYDWQREAEYIGERIAYEWRRIGKVARS